MRCPIMYAPDRWGLIELPESQLEKPVVQLAFRGNDAQVEPGAPRSISSMITFETKTFRRIDFVSKSVPYHIYFPE